MGTYTNYLGRVDNKIFNEISPSQVKIFKKYTAVFTQ